MIPPHDPQKFAANVPVCHGCPLRSAGLCEDGVEIRHHADAGYCPQSRFAENLPQPAGWCELRTDTRHETRDTTQHSAPSTQHSSLPLAGDIAAAALAKLGADKLAKWWEKISGVGCGCKDRQQKWNRFDRAVRRKLRDFLAR